MAQIVHMLSLHNEEIKGFSGEISHASTSSKQKSFKGITMYLQDVWCNFRKYANLMWSLSRGGEIILRPFQWVSLLLLCAFFLGNTIPAQASINYASNPIPTLAYYYIWFDSTSWNRAKIDYPLLGHYSSDDRTVMRQHIRWAKAAGIDGFIVSWKSTDVLNRRLSQLTDLAEEEDFKLVIIYQGLDFERNPLPADRIATDLDYFIQNFSGRSAFSLFAKPLVIWSGTWKFSEQDIERVAQVRRQSLLILASERNRDDYLRLARLVDGNAYYWSSVNPETYKRYLEKLSGMAEAVHQNGGLWIPPAAPGFDARMVGGTSEVARKEGDTFRVEINTAMKSSPDALGIISWNEFSENTHIEPSENFGTRYLDILSEINQLPTPQIGEFDSSETAGIVPEFLSGSRVMAFSLILLVTLFGFFVIARRQR